MTHPPRDKEQPERRGEPVKSDPDLTPYHPPQTRETDEEAPEGSSEVM